MLETHLFPCLADNYGFLVHDPASGETIAIDTPDGDEYLRQADARGWRITQVWNTHWHPDHTGGNAAIVIATGAVVSGPAEVQRVAHVDRVIAGGDTLTLGAWSADVIDVAGHTNGHIAFHLPDAGQAFVGDSLFPLGCGRIFEGTPDVFWGSLVRLKALPRDTIFYGAHEYAQSNARFALRVDPGNAELAAYAREIEHLRARGEPTVPTTLERQLRTNPFLRADEADMQERCGTSGDPVATFAALRREKDAF